MKEDLMKKLILLLALIVSSLSATAQDMSNGAANFYKSDKVTVQKVTFRNQYQMNVAGSAKNVSCNNTMCFFMKSSFIQ